MDIKKILLEVINEAANGKIVIDNEDWYISFNTVINGYNNAQNDSDVVLQIDDIDEFVFYLKIYIEKEQALNRKSIKFSENNDYNSIKFLISYLFVNATFIDFKEPIKYIKRIIKSLDDNTLSIFDSGKNIKLGQTFYNSNLIIKNTKQSILMETPNKIELTLISEDGQFEFKLPEISYAIIEENGNKVCYIYSVLNKEIADNFKKNKYQKSISRLFYKLNENVFMNESEEFKNYKQNLSSYYPENISDISVTSLLSLYIFVMLLSKFNVSDIIGVPYLPIRYSSRDIAASKIEDEVLKNNLIERNENIQNNITNKFIRMFNRLEFHIKDFHVDSYPFEIDEFIRCRMFCVNKEIDNKLLEEIEKSFKNL